MSKENPDFGAADLIDHEEWFKRWIIHGNVFRPCQSTKVNWEYTVGSEFEFQKRLEIWLFEVDQKQLNYLLEIRRKVAARYSEKNEKCCLELIGLINQDIKRLLGL